jgi:peptidoglycan/LPS O-acetylase OafA/YrhL
MMSSHISRSSIDEKPRSQHGHVDLEVGHGLTSTKSSKDRSSVPLKEPQESGVIQRLLRYPPPGSLKLRQTSWLDGVRGVAALGVYIFHATGCWANIVAAWHSDVDQNNLLQMPVIRTIFVSGGAAVSLFFALSGYVLTHKSLRCIRGGSTRQVYPSVASSMFRRGIRLYLPPIILTFCEMLATRAGFAPPLNFTFVPESSTPAQFLDWVAETNRFVNPVYNFQRAVQGYVTHTKYDAVIWTIPLEFYGSFVCYILLLISLRLPSNNVRMGIVAMFSAFCMTLGSWNFFCFSAGMLIADFNLGQEENDSSPSPKSVSSGMWWAVVFALSFYVVCMLLQPRNGNITTN